MENLSAAPTPAPSGEVLTESAATPRPIDHTPPPAAEPVEAKAPVNPRDAVDQAFKKLEAKEAEAKAAPKAEKVEAEPKARTEDGKFAAKAEPKVAEAAAKAAPAPEPVQGANQSEGRAPRYEVPARFSDQGKAEWAKAPESVQAETTRALSEMEKGLTKYKESAERWDSVREYDDLARRNGMPNGVSDSLKKVVEMEQAFMRNPIEGMQKVANHFGLNIQAIAAHIMGQNPDHQVAEAHNRIRELEAKIASMEHEARAPAVVNDFFSQNPDAVELSEDIAFVLKTGNIRLTGDDQEDIKTAYEFVKRFKPASYAGHAPKASEAEPVPAPLIPAAAPPAPNPAGQKSLTGAPTSTSPVAGKNAHKVSAREATKAALAQFGL